MALFDIPTIPTLLASELRARPPQPPADPLATIQAQQEEQMRRNWPQFLRELAAQMQAAPPSETELPATAPVSPVVPEDEEAALFVPAQQPVVPTQPQEPVQPPIAPPTRPYQPIHPLPEPIITKSPVGKFLGKVGDIAETALSPVGKAIETGIEYTGKGIQRLPGLEGVGETVERIPRAAAVGKQVFAQEFERKTGQPLNLETALSAINEYGFKPLAEAPGRAIDWVTDRTIDPLLEKTLPKAASKKAIAAIDIAGGFAPWIALAFLAPELAGPRLAAAGFAAVDTAFALSSSDTIKNLYSAYRNGQLKGKEFLLGAGLEAINIVGPPAAFLLGRALRAHRTTKELRQTIEKLGGDPTPAADKILPAIERAGQVGETIDVSPLGVMAQTRGDNMFLVHRTAPDAPAVLRRTDEGLVLDPLPDDPNLPFEAKKQLALAAYMKARYLEPGGKMYVSSDDAVLFESLLPDGAVVRRDATTGEPLDFLDYAERLNEGRRESVVAEVNLPKPEVTTAGVTRAPEETPAPLGQVSEHIQGMPGNARHTLRTEAGDRLEWRESPEGAHLVDVTVIEERKGRGTELLSQALKDMFDNAKARGIEYPYITADINTEGGARLINRFPFVEFFDLSGNSLRFEEALENLRRGRGVTARIYDSTRSRNYHIAREIKDEVLSEELEAGRPREAETRAVEEAAPTTTREAGEQKIVEASKTYDKVARREIFRGEGVAIYQREDNGLFTMIFPAWETLARPVRESQENLTVADIREFFDELRQVELAGGLRASDYSDAIKAIEDAAQGFERRTHPVLEEARRIAAEYVPPREEVAQSLRYRQRPVREALEVARTEQAWRPMVEDTLANGGATYSPRTLEPEPFEGYFVGGFAPTKKVPVEEFSPQTIADYLREHFDDVFSKREMLVGTELVEENGKQFVNIDAVRRVDDLDEAFQIARAAGEERIYDANNQRTLTVPGVKQTQKPVQKPAAEKPPAESKHDPDSFLNTGELGYLDVKRIGQFGQKLMQMLQAAIRRVLEIAKRVLREETGQVRLGRRKREVIPFKFDEMLDAGAARRWLFPMETWDEWAKKMADYTGIPAERWLRTKNRIAQHVENRIAALEGGEPAVFDRLRELAEAGKNISFRGRKVDGSLWYVENRKVFTDIFGEDAPVAAKIFAVTQSNASPSAGVTLTIRAYTQWKLGLPISGMSNKVIATSIERVLMGADPSGIKINPFWKAVWNAADAEIPPIDRHIFRAIGVPESEVRRWANNEHLHRFVQELLRQGAREANMNPPAKFQAAIWGGIRPEGDPRSPGAILLDLLRENQMRWPKGLKLDMKEAQLHLGQGVISDAIEEAQLAQANRLLEKLGQQASKVSEQTRLIWIRNLERLEWNFNLAAAHLLETGDVPAYIRTPAVREYVETIANHRRQAFTVRISQADEEVLRKVSKLEHTPGWQKKLIEEELTKRKRFAEQQTQTFRQLPKEEQERLTALGWHRIPDNPVEQQKVAEALRQLSEITTEGELRKWLNSAMGRRIAGDPQAFLGKRIRTGEVRRLRGYLTEKEIASPYWHPAPFYENRMKLDIDLIKQTILSRYNMLDNTAGGPVITAVRKAVKNPLATCGMGIAETMA